MHARYNQAFPLPVLSMPSFRTLAARGLLVGAMVAALLACGGDKPEAGGRGGPGGPGGADRPVPVVVQTVREQPWQDTLRALGTVKARESIEVTAKVSETVQQVHFSDGDAVGRGAALVTLSGAQQQAALRAAEATAREADSLFRRQQQLASQQLISRAMFDQQKATRDAAQAQVAQIRANLSDRVIRAPFAGVLGMRQVSPGALVTPGTVITTLDDIARVYVDFPVPESQLAGVGTGQAVAGTTSTHGDRGFSGSISSIDPRIDVSSRAATVRGDSPNPDRALKPGMLMEVEITRGEVPALVIPEIALQQQGTESFVWRVGQDGSVERVVVEVGGRIPGKVMVEKGLAAGDRIVTDGVGKLRAGSKVQATAADAAAAPRATPAAAG